MAGSKDWKFVYGLYDKLETDYSVQSKPIPWATPNATPPSYKAPTADLCHREISGQGGAKGGNETWRSTLTPSMYARLNIVYNLMNIKQELVNNIYNMLLKTPPMVMDPETGKMKQHTNTKDFEIAANQIADAYIRAVDKFLKDHPGALPSLGARSTLLDLVGIQNPTNSPWCADWAEGVIKNMQDNLKGKTEANRLVVLEWDQYKQSKPEYQHNFPIVRPRGYQTQYLPNLDPVILLLDAWRNLLPRSYNTNNDVPAHAPTNKFEGVPK
jgi:hypothetical protein